jgi:hypothetical protein
LEASDWICDNFASTIHDFRENCIMRSLPLCALVVSILFGPLTVFADPHKDESGHGKRKHGHREFKEEYWDGNCKIERKLEKGGEYKEERKCKGAGYQRPGHAYAPAPVYVQPPPPPVYVQPPEPGVVIHGTVRVR